MALGPYECSKSPRSGYYNAYESLLGQKLIWHAFMPKLLGAAFDSIQCRQAKAESKAHSLTPTHQVSETISTDMLTA